MYTIFAALVEEYKRMTYLKKKCLIFSHLCMLHHFEINYEIANEMIMIFFVGIFMVEKHQDAQV